MHGENQKIILNLRSKRMCFNDFACAEFREITCPAPIWEELIDSIKTYGHLSKTNGIYYFLNVKK